MPVEHVGVVRNDGIARPLGEETQREQDDEPVAVALGFEEVQVRGVRVRLHFQFDCLLDLLVFELDRWVVAVSVAMVLGQDVERFLMLVLCHEVSGRLRNPPDEDDLHNRRQALSQSRDTPCPGGVDIVGAQ